MLTAPWLSVLMIALLVAAAIAVAVLLAVVHAPDDTERYVEYAAPDFGADADFALTATPKSDVLKPRRTWLINHRIAELEYDVAPGKSARLRVAPAGTPLVPAAYRDAPYQNTGTVQVDGTPVTVSHSPGGPGLATWRRDGFDYALMLPDPEMNMLGGLVNDFVTGTKAVLR